MRAVTWEYRWRFTLHAVVYVLAFAAPWNYVLHLDGGKTLWEWAALRLYTGGWMRFQLASVALLVAAILFAALGAWFRIWGTAYLGARVVHAAGMHGNLVVADGPYRHVRNPLYLGTWLNMLALALIMPPSGALFAVVVIGLMQLRLIGAEEVFLRQRLGEPYAEYCRQVPQLLPSYLPRVRGSDTHPQWLQALLGEIFMIGTALTYAILGWRYNSRLLMQGVLVSLGAWIVVRALMPKPQENA